MTNLTDLTDVSTFTGFLQWGNGMGEGYLGILLLLLFWVVSFILSLNWTSFSKSALVASTIGLLWCVFALIIGIIIPSVLAFVIFLFVGSLFLAYISP